MAAVLALRKRLLNTVERGQGLMTKKMVDEGMDIVQILDFLTEQHQNEGRTAAERQLEQALKKIDKLEKQVEKKVQKKEKEEKKEEKKKGKGKPGSSGTGPTAGVAQGAELITETAQRVGAEGGKLLGEASTAFQELAYGVNSGTSEPCKDPNSEVCQKEAKRLDRALGKP